MSDVRQAKLSTELHSNRQPPSPERVRAQQRAAAEKDLLGATLPAVVAKAEVAPLPELHSVDEYLKRNPARMCLGRPIRPNLKTGKWVYADDKADTPLPADVTFAVLYDLAWVGLVRLEANQPAQYDGGFLFQPDFKRSSRAALGDQDPSQWPLSQFDQQPTDPWKEAIYLPLEQLPSGEMVTVQIQSKPRSAAIFAVDGLIAHCQQLSWRDPDSLPLVKLGIGSYESTKFGTQYKPVFQVLGKTPKGGHAKPSTSIGDDMNDSVDL